MEREKKMENDHLPKRRWKLPLYKESHGEDEGQWVPVTSGEIPVGHKRPIIQKESNQLLQKPPQGAAGFPNAKALISSWTRG